METSNSPALCDSIFSNRLILSSIVVHLPYPALKICRALNTTWHAACLKKFNKTTAVYFGSRDVFANYLNKYPDGTNFHTEYRFGPQLNLTFCGTRAEDEAMVFFPNEEQLDGEELLEFFQIFASNLRILEASFVWGANKEEMTQLEKILNTLEHVEKMRLRIFKASEHRLPSRGNLTLNSVQSLRLCFGSSAPWGISDFSEAIFSLFPSLENLTLLPFNDGGDELEKEVDPILDRLTGMVLTQLTPHPNDAVLRYGANVQGLGLIPMKMHHFQSLLALRKPLERLELFDGINQVFPTSENMDLQLTRVLECHSLSLKYLKVSVALDNGENDRLTFPQLEDAYLKLVSRVDPLGEIRFPKKFPKLKTLVVEDESGGVFVEMFINHCNVNGNLRQLRLIMTNPPEDNGQMGDWTRHILERVKTVFPNVRNSVTFQ